MIGDQSPIYTTCRVGRTITYDFLGLPAGSYDVILKFAEIDPQKPRGRFFDFTITSGAAAPQGRTNYSVSAVAGGDFTTRDERFPVPVTLGDTIKIEFRVGSLDVPLINAIEIIPS